MARNPALKLIDRTSPEPFYLQLARLVEDAIGQGEFSPGGKLPGETELCRRYDLARSTVREALRALEDRRRIRIVPRRGAFVEDPEKSGWVLQVAEGFFEGEVDHHQRKVETRVLEARLCEFPAEPAKALGLGRDEKGFLLRRLRRLDGQLALYSENYLIPELANIVLESEAVEPHGSLNRVLQRAGYRVFAARRTVEAVPAPAAIAKLLKVASGSPLLLVTSVSWREDEKPFDFYKSWVRTDVVKISVEASADRGQR